MGGVPQILGLVWGRRGGDREGDWLDAAEVERIGSRLHHRLEDGRCRLAPIGPADLRRALTAARPRRKWSADEDALIAEASTPRLRAALADLMGRSADSIARRRRRLAKRGG